MRLSLPIPCPTLAEIEMAMRVCEQRPRHSTLDHGNAVHAAFRVLRAHALEGAPIPAWWRLPDWALDRALWGRLPPAEILEEYHRYHDCGKGSCRIVDEDGRQHFPNHADISEQLWRAAGGNELAARLMGLDMVVHTLKPEDCQAFAALPEAPALLLTAIAETHANAETFGGTDSDSFKAKAKRLASRGRSAISHMNLNSALRSAA